MVFIFKTNVQTKNQIQSLKLELDSLFSETHWNFDLEDCDNILRVESEYYIQETVIKLLENNNLYCKELE
ncbi:hypothetical protein [uncultured Maribacter sp.]|uniref:hypothetical protein n=1 Tax=uncultured Maribacter sp. TaxID=431308 RepID=UPI002629C419|nr:hypothetical protein [uncultured Maribacter sp.]